MFIYNGGQEPENNVRAAIVVTGQLDYASITGTYSVPVPGGYFVDRVDTVVSEVFDGTPALTIGDGDDADGYQDNTDLALGTALSVTTPAVKLSRNAGNPYANGKYYPTDDTIDFAWTKGTSPTTGVLKFAIHMIKVQKGGVPAGLTTKTPL